MPSPDDYPQLQFPYPLSPEMADYVRRGMAINMAPTRPPVAPVQAPPPPPNGVLTDIGHGLAAGTMVDIPELVGRATQAFTPDDSAINRLGARITQFGKEREDLPEYQTTGAWGAGARGVPIVAGLLAGGELLAPLVGGGAVASAAGGALTAGGLFGGSTYQQVKEDALAAGASPELAHTQALKAGGVQGVGQGLLQAVGGKVLSGTAGVLANKFVAKGGVDAAIKSFTDPGLFKPFAKNYLELMGVQLPLQAGIAASMNEIEQGAGIDTKQSSWEAAKGSLAPTAAMTTLLAPVGLIGARRSNQAKERMAQIVAGDVPGATVDQRLKVLSDMSGEMSKSAPLEEVKEWQSQATLAINAEQKVGMNADFKYVDPATAAGTPAEPPAAPPAEPPAAPPEAPVGPPRPTTKEALAQWEAQQRQEAGVDAQQVQDEQTQEALARQARAAQENIPDAARAAGGPPTEPPAGGVPAEPPRQTLLERVPRAPESTQFMDLPQEPTKQQQVDDLKRNFLPTAPKELVARLVGPIEDMPAKIKALWEEKGGEKSEATYVKHLGDLYKQITGEDIRGEAKDEIAARNKPSEVAPEDRARTEPGPAAVQAEPIAAARAVEVPQGERDATTGTAGGAAAQESSLGAASNEPPVKLDRMRQLGELLRAAQAPKVTKESKAKAAKATAKAEAEQAISEAARHEPPTAAEGAEALATGAPEDAGTFPTGDTNALIPGEAERGTEPQGGIGGGEAAGAGAGDSTLGGAAGSTEAQGEKKLSNAEFAALRARNLEAYRAQKNAELIAQGKVGEARQTAENIARGVKLKAKQAMHEKNARELQDEITKWRGGTTELAREQAALEQKRRDGTLTNLEENRIADLKRSVAQRDVQEKRLIQRRSEETGKAQQYASRSEEPAREAAYWTFANHDVIKNGGTRDTLSFLEAKKITGTATPEELKLLSERKGTTRNDPKAKREAQLALQEIDKNPNIRKTLQERVQRLLNVEGRSANIELLAKKDRARVMRQINEEAFDQARYDEWIQNNNDNFKKGLISKEEHDANALEAWAKAAEQGGIKKRGLAALDDPALAAHVTEGMLAHEVMTHIAENHHDPLMRSIAKMLAEANPNAEVRVIDQPDFNGGRYNPANHTIEIGRGGMNPITMMHETVHALTHAGIYRAMDNIHRTDLSPHAQREVEALKTIRDIMAKFAKVADLSDPSHRIALEDEHEFLSEALNNPSIQEALGARPGLLQRFWNAVRQFIPGLNKVKPTDFERLMEVTPTLFGDPKRDSLDVFHRDEVESTKDANGNFLNTPKGAIASAKSTMGQLWQKTMEMMFKGNAKEQIQTKTLRWVTYNHAMQWLERRVAALKEKFPDPKHQALFDKVTAALAYPKSILERKAASAMLLNNAPGESSDVSRMLGELQRTQPARLGAMAEFAHRARDSGIPPWFKSFTEARFYNPKLTQKAWDAAKPLRDEYQRMHPDAKKAYDAVIQHNGLSLTRHYATLLDTINRQWGMKENPDLDFVTHTRVRDAAGNERSQLDKAAQHKALNAAMDKARAEVDARLKAAGFDPESKAGKAATEHKETVDSLFEEYNKQRSVPYVHRGRSGDFMIHFDVRGGTAEWEAVRTIVKGLNRDMGPEIDGNRTVDMRFDNELQHVQAIRAFDALQKAGTFKIGEGDKAENSFAAGRVAGRFKTTDGATATFLRKLRAKIYDTVPDEKLADEINRQITDTYLQQLPESSPLKATMQADLTAGASKDFLKTFADRQTMANRALVGAQTASRMGDAIAHLNDVMKEVNGTPEMQGEVANEFGRYAEEIRNRVNDLATPVNSPGVDIMRAIAAPFRLALSPAYLLMTAYQPLQMTLPFLGKDHGFVKSAASMYRNYGKSYGALNAMFKQAWDLHKGTPLWDRLIESANPSVDFSQLKNKDGTYMFTGAQLELMNHLQDSGLVNFGQMQQIWRMQAPGEEHPLSKLAKPVSDINRMASAFPHYVEMSNRIVAALSAHELSLEKQGVKNHNEATQAQKEIAQKYAMSTIRNTDGDHSQGNIARALGRRGFLRQATPLVVGFNQYDFQMMESLSRLAVTSFGKGQEAVSARKGLGYVALMTGMMAGTLGLPFMGLITGLYNQIVGGMQDDASTPPDFEKSVRDMMDSIFGEKGGEIAARGLPRLLDIDMSTRSGYQDLAPFTSFLEDRQKLGDRIKDQALNFLGPAVGVGVGMATGARAVYEGDWPKAINDGLPAFMRNLAKAWRMNQYGYERLDGANEQIPIEASSWNQLAQAGGFGSGAKAEQSEKQFQWRTNSTLLQNRAAIIRNNWLRGMTHEDPQGVGDAMEQLVNFARTQPQFAHAPGGVAGAMRQQMQDVELARMFGGVAVKKGKIPFLQHFQQGSGGADYPALAAPNY